MFPYVGDLIKLKYGTNLLQEVTKDMTDYLVVTDKVIYDLLKDRLNNKHTVYFVKDVEVETIEKDIKEFENISGVLGLGGGLAVDAAKYIAESMSKKLYSFPTVLSVNAAFCYKSAMRKNNVVTYMGRIFPEAIYIDFDIIRAAPKHLNISGAADLLACLTASYDWKINSLVTKSHKFSQEIYDGAQDLLGLLAEHVDDIKEVNEKGIYYMCEAYKWIGEHSAIMNHTMWESASEHAMFDNMEFICKKAFLHGQIIALCIFFMSNLQDNQHERAVMMVKRFGIDISYKGLGITKDQLITGLKTLKDFVKHENLRYTIIQAKNITDEWIETTVSKYEKEFN